MSYLGKFFTEFFYTSQNVSIDDPDQTKPKKLGVTGLDFEF